MQRAVVLMITRAALGLVGVVLTLALRHRLERQVSHDDPAGAAGHLAHVEVVIAIVVGLLITVAYVLLARQVRVGHPWARIVTWVLAGLGVLSAFGDAATVTTRVLSLLLGALDLAVIVLLAQSAANRWFRPRAAGGTV